MVPSVEVLAEPSSGGGRWLRTDDQGEATLRGLPVGEVVVHAGRAGVYGRADASATGAFVASSSATVEPGRSATVTLQVPARDAWVAGTVIDRDGVPVADASVRLESVWEFVRPDGMSVRSVAATSTTDIDGQFRIEGLEDGTYFVSATARGRGAAVGPFEANQELLPLRLPDAEAPDP
jgi:hypothetical protein